MATLVRNDIHRPAAIIPLDYFYVGIQTMKIEGLEDVYEIRENRERIKAHMASTGGTWSHHAHGGSCHVCGAHAQYLAVFYHRLTNSYIMTGMDCADKLDMGDERDFRAFRAAIDDTRKLLKGSNKARAVLADAGLSRAWEIYKASDDALRQLGAIFTETRGEVQCEFNTKELNTLRDVVGKLVKYGSLSEKQLEFLGKLIKQVDNKVAYEAEKAAKLAAERAVAADCPTGRMVITGEVLSTRVDEGVYGVTYKMLVRDDRGFKCWGSVPSSIPGDKGSRVTFTATLTQSDRDVKFGFYSRPSKAKELVAATK